MWPFTKRKAAAPTAPDPHELAAELVTEIAAARGQTLVKSQLATAIRSALGSGGPGQWATDHYEESRRFTGWDYVAVHSAAVQAMGADVVCMATAHGNRLTKAARRRKLKSWRQSLAKSHDLEIPEGFDELPDDHRLPALLARPNRTTSGSALLYEIVQQLELTGTALVVQVRGTQTGLPVELYSLPTGAAEPVRPGRKYPYGAYRVSRGVVSVQADGFTELDGYAALAGKLIPAQDVITIRWAHPLIRDDGISPVAAGALWSDASAQLDKARWNQFRQGVMHGIIISLKGPDRPSQEEIQRALEAIKAKRSGPENAGLPWMVPGDVNVTQPSPKDMDYQHGFVQLRDALLAIHQTPGVAAGITDGGSYSAFYAALKQYTTLKIQPMLGLIADELTEQLASQFSRYDGVEYVVLLHAANVDDPTLLEQQLANDDAVGCMTLDERRRMRGLPPDGGELGPKYLFELKTPSGLGGPPPGTQAPGPGPADLATERDTGIPDPTKIREMAGLQRDGDGILNEKSHRLNGNGKSPADPWADYP